MQEVDGHCFSFLADLGFQCGRYFWLWCSRLLRGRSTLPCIAVAHALRAWLLFMQNSCPVDCHMRHHLLSLSTRSWHPGRLNFLEEVILLRIWLVLLFAFINSILQLQDIHIFAEVNKIIYDYLMFLLLFFISSSFFEMCFWFRNSFHNFGLVWKRYYLGASWAKFGCYVVILVDFSMQVEEPIQTKFLQAVDFAETSWYLEDEVVVQQ